MNQEVPLEELLEQMSKTRHTVRRVAEETLRKSTKRRWQELVAILARPERHRHQRTIMECLFQYTSTSLLDELSFTLDHPNTRLRADFAEQVAKSGKMYALPLIEQFLSDADPSIRRSASNGLSDRSESTWSKLFARKVVPLLIQFIKDYPDDNAPSRNWALEIFDPVRYANLEAELDEDDPVRPIIREAFDMGERYRSHRQAIDGFDSHPVGYRYVYATNFVDVEIRNGGISQLYGNSSWGLMIDAIEGPQAFGYRKLSLTLKEIVFYYHRKGRSKLKRRTPEGFFDNLKPRWNKSLSTLEDDYYQCFRQLKANDIWDLWARAIEKKPQLFEQVS